MEKRTFDGKFPMKNLNLWGISGGIKFGGFSVQFLHILFMWKYEGEMNFSWGNSK